MTDDARALYDRISEGDLEAVRSLLARSVDLTHRWADGSTPLHLAAEESYYEEDLPEDRQEEIVRLLLEAGADPNAAKRDGDTPYDLSVDSRISQLLEPLTTPAQLTSEQEELTAGLRHDLALLRERVAQLEAPAARKALLKSTKRRVVEWQWLSNSFGSPEPHYSERRRFPRPRLLKGEPTARQLANGVTKLGVDRSGRRILEQDVMHASASVIDSVVYERLEPDLVCAICIDSFEVKWAWCARVAERRPLTKVHVVGAAEVFHWEGTRLVAVDSWDRLDRRTRPGPREELTHDLRGRLLSVEWITPSGERRSVYRRKAKGETLETVGAALRKELVRAIPVAVERAALEEPAYCLVVAWTGASPSPPWLGLGLERERKGWRSQGDDSVWSAPEFENFCTPALSLEDDVEVRRIGQRYRELLDLSTKSPHHEVYRAVARDLNGLEWSEILPVTEDFVVFPSDLELVGLAGHLRAVLGAKRARSLVANMGCPPPD